MSDEQLHELKGLIDRLQDRTDQLQMGIERIEDALCEAGMHLTKGGKVDRVQLWHCSACFGDKDGADCPMCAIAEESLDRRAP